MRMASAPLISVVIPCYNQGRFLQEAIRSVGPSTSRPTEIIVVDDGSTDDTQTVAVRFPEVVYRFQPNRGIASARNAGLHESRGEFIVFLDADDMLAPGALDTGVAALEANPDCVFTTGRCVMMDAAGILQETPQQSRLTCGAYDELLRHNYIWMPAMAMFRTSVVKEVGGFNTDEAAAADYDLYLRIARRWPGYDHAGIVAYYRQHDASMSTSPARMLRETLRVHDRERSSGVLDPARIARLNEGRRLWQDFYGERLVNEIRQHVRAGDWQTAARKIVTLARYHPRGLTHHALRKASLLIRRDRGPRDRR